MTGMLCSVTSAHEALLVLQHGADIIDLKNPQQGALGALPLDVIQQIVACVAKRKPVSATVGDLAMHPGLVTNAVREMAATGVDLVKIGFFGDSGHADCILALAEQSARGVRMVAVLFADQQSDFGMLPLLAQCGFQGVMLDTANKNGRRLLHSMPLPVLQEFVKAARQQDLLVGLAGSLAASDISELMDLDADYLGFRGALCREADRKQALDIDRMKQIRLLLQNYNTVVKEFA